MLTYPALVTLLEFAVSRLSPHGTFGSIAYSQAGVLPLTQIASVAGIWGITFVVSLIPAVAVVMWIRRGDRRALISGGALAVLTLGIAFGYGYWRLSAFQPGKRVRIGLAGSDSSSIHFAATNAAEGLSVISQYAARVDRLADRGAQIVVLPEKFVGIAPEYADSARSIFSAVARQRHVVVVAGFNESGRMGLQNIAVVFDEAGRIPLEFVKVHLIGGLERDYAPGDTIGLVDLSRLRAGVAICKDLDFSGFMRRYAHAKIGVLLVPAWDFSNDAWLHSRMAILRGVEGGYAIARTATKGQLTVSDAFGRVIAEGSSASGPEVLLTADVPAENVTTIYAGAGDWTPAACLLLVATVVIRRRRLNPPEQPKAGPGSET